MTRADMEREASQITELCRSLSEAWDIAIKLTVVNNAAPLVRAISEARIAANEVAIEIEERMDRTPR